MLVKITDAMKIMIFFNYSILLYTHTRTHTQPHYTLRPLIYDRNHKRNNCVRTWHIYIILWFIHLGYNYIYEFVFCFVSALKVKLMLRRPINQLVAQGIMPCKYTTTPGRHLSTRKTVFISSHPVFFMMHYRLLKVQRPFIQLENHT